MPFIVKPRHGCRRSRVRRRPTHPRTCAACPPTAPSSPRRCCPARSTRIDVLGSPDGRIVAVVPRRRDKVDSGIAVAGRTFADASLEAVRSRGRRGDRCDRRRQRAGQDRQPRACPRCSRSTPGSPGPCRSPRRPASTCRCSRSRRCSGMRCPTRSPFREVAVVRHWTEIVVPVEEYATVDPTASVPRAAVAGDDRSSTGRHRRAVRPAHPLRPHGRRGIGRGDGRRRGRGRARRLGSLRPRAGEHRPGSPSTSIATRAMRRDGLRDPVRRRGEAAGHGRAGWTCRPSCPMLDYVLVADHQFPGPDGPLHPDVVRARRRALVADRRGRGRRPGAGDRRRSRAAARTRRSSLTCSACCPRSASPRTRPDRAPATLVAVACLAAERRRRGQREVAVPLGPGGRLPSPGRRSDLVRAATPIGPRTSAATPISTPSIAGVRHVPAGPTRPTPSSPDHDR